MERSPQTEREYQDDLRLRHILTQGMSKADIDSLGGPGLLAHRYVDAFYIQAKSKASEGTVFASKEALSEALKDTTLDGPTQRAYRQALVLHELHDMLKRKKMKVADIRATIQQVLESELRRVKS